MTYYWFFESTIKDVISTNNALKNELLDIMYKKVKKKEVLFDYFKELKIWDVNNVVQKFFVRIIIKLDSKV